MFPNRTSSCGGRRLKARGDEDGRMKAGGRTSAAGENACCLAYFYKGLYYVQNLYTFPL